MADDKVLPGYFERTRRAVEIVGPHSARRENVTTGSRSYSETIPAYLLWRHRQQLERGLSRSVLLQCRWAACDVARRLRDIAFRGDPEECNHCLPIEKRQKH